MTELSERLKRDLEEGQSIRGIGRKANMSNSTVRRALAGLELDHSTIEKFSRYLKLPIEEVYHMSGNIPSVRSSGNPRRDWLLSQIWTGLSMLTNSEQAEILASVLRLVEQHEKSTEGEKTNS